VERIIDLEHQRYADREYEGELAPGAAAAEQRQAERKRRALLRLKIRAASGDQATADLLTVLGLDE